MKYNTIQYNRSVHFSSRYNNMWRYLIAACLLR